MSSLVKFKKFSDEAGYSSLSEAYKRKPKPTAPAEILAAVDAHPKADVMRKFWSFDPNERSGRVYIYGGDFPQYVWIDKKNGICEYRFKSRGHIYGGETLPEEKIGDLLTLLLIEYFKRCTPKGMTSGDFQRLYDSDPQWVLDNMSTNKEEFFDKVMRKIKGESYDDVMSFDSLDRTLLDEMEKKGYISVNYSHSRDSDIYSRNIRIRLNFSMLKKFIQGYNPIGISFFDVRYGQELEFGIKVDGRDGISLVNEYDRKTYRWGQKFFNETNMRSFFPGVRIKAKSKEDFNRFFYEGFKKSILKFIPAEGFLVTNIEAADIWGNLRGNNFRQVCGALYGKYEKDKTMDAFLNELLEVYIDINKKISDIFAGYVFEERSETETAKMIDDLVTEINGVFLPLVASSSPLVII